MTRVTLHDLKSAINAIPPNDGTSVWARVDYEGARADAWRIACLFMLSNAMDEREPEGSDELSEALGLLEEQFGENFAEYVR